METKKPQAVLHQSGKSCHCPHCGEEFTVTTRDAVLSDEQIIKIAKAELSYTSGGEYYSMETPHYYGDEEWVLDFAKAILAAQRDLSLQTV